MAATIRRIGGQMSDEPVLRLRDYLVPLAAPEVKHLKSIIEGHRRYLQDRIRDNPQSRDLRLALQDLDLRVRGEIK